MSDRAVRWSQDSIRRAAEAIKENYSTDFIVLATRALRAAVRTEKDLLELLDDRPKPAFKSKKSGAVAA
jgi:hypothetical protein